MANQKLMTPEEVATLLRVSRHTIYYWIRKGRIRAFHVGKQWRIQREDLPEGYIETPEASHGKSWQDVARRDGAR